MNIEPKYRAEIMERLAKAEADHNVKVLFAVESGSRAWGFDSKDSDYDVRFVYKHPRDWYLSVYPGRDVIEYPIVDLVDINGWDIRKALHLFYKSNPPLLEWIASPIIYIDGELRTRLNSMVEQFFSPRGCSYHYLHMAQGNFREYLKREFVRTKKYFYVLRPVLACMWIEKYDQPAPMLFEEMLDDLIPEGELKDAISGLLVRKRAGEELDKEPPILVIQDFLGEKIVYFENAISERPKPLVDIGPLDALFREFILED